MEYGHFKRRDNRDFRDRDRDRGGDHRDRGYNRDRGEYRDRGYNRDRNDRGDRGDREPDESVFSKRVRAGKRRTYFLDVKKTRGNDYFITITESTRREDGYGYKRHKIFLYKEDFNRFVESLNEVVNHVKTELMPDFDYEEFDRRQAEWEAQNRDFDEDDDRSSNTTATAVDEAVEEEQESGDDEDAAGEEEEAEEKQKKDDDDDVAW
ncbi:MAG: DUF3276 family protein [Saprospiraceae bacterium]